MRHVKNALLVLFTLALVALGAVMPFAASRWQDTRQAGVEVRSFDSFLLTLKQKGDLSQILRFFAENRYYMFIEEAPETAVLSEDEVREAAMEAVDMMFRCGIISKDIIAAIESNKAAGVDQSDVEMSRLASETDPEANSFIVWGVDWYNLGISVWLDDASGKAFQISSYNRLWDSEIYDSNASAGSTGMTRESLYARMDNWRLFLENYYEANIVNIDEIPYSYAQSFVFYIDLEDGGGKIPVRLHMYEEGDFLSIEYNEEE